MDALKNDLLYMLGEKGAVEEPSPYKEYRRFVSGNGRVYWLGADLSVRCGNSPRNSIDITRSLLRALGY